MPKKWYIVWALILIFAAFVRLHELPARAPFDWDQNRDYQKVENIINGKLTLLGPVAKGDTGFYLGPLYYYLLVPGYLLSGGHPLSFTVTSIILDLTTIALILHLARQRPKSRLTFTLLGTIWAFSWFIVGNSQISWNVSLLPLWVILMYAFATSTPHNNLRLFFYGLVAGTSWHIHASLLPLGLILPILFLPTRKRSIENYLYLLLGYLTALLPLLIFDLRHAFFNTRLMLNFANNSSTIAGAPVSMLVVDILTKIGKNSLGILTGNLTPHLQVGILALLFAFWGILTKKIELVWSGLIVLLNFIFVLLLRDLRFPEYYLAVGYIPLLILLISFIGAMFTTIKMRVGLLILIVICFGSNISTYTFEPTPYSLQNKNAAVLSVAKLSRPVDVRYELSSGREGGIVPLLKLYQVQVTESAPTKIIFTDKVGGPVVIGDELATDVLQAGGMRVVKYEAK